jgi:thioredoxin
MIVELTRENFEREILESDKPVVIDFWAEWCGPCRMMAPVFKELSEEMKDVKFAKLDTEDQPEIAGEFRIRGIPTLSIVKGTEEISRITGYAPKEELKKRIEEALKKR